MEQIEGTNNRKIERLYDAYLMGLRARKFEPEQLITQASELIEFAIKFNLANGEKVDY